jgi:DNA-binding transcriptional MerR regulator
VGETGPGGNGRGNEVSPRRARPASARALRYYEEQRLLAPDRTLSGQRVYPSSAVERVRLIQQFFTAGLPSRTILQLLPCVDSGEGSPEVFEMLAAERRRITDAMADISEVGAPIRGPRRPPQ